MKKGDGHGERGDGELDEEARSPPTLEPARRNPQQGMLPGKEGGGADDGAAIDG